MATALKAKGIEKKYGEREVLKDFSLELEAGSFEALMGPSGSGKSTFLHLAAGLLAVDGGELFVAGENLAQMNDTQATKFRREHIGVVFQSFNLLSEKTVEENILFPLKLGGWHPFAPTAALRRGLTLASTLLERLGLKGLERKYPEQLSGGEQQRVAIARALISEPALILADEPTGSLDAGSTKEFCQLLQELNGSVKSAILLVTHDPQVAAYASRVHFLKDGKIAASYATENDADRVSRLYMQHAA